MSQDDPIEYSALHWVKKELDALLDDARAALEAYIEDDSQSDKLVDTETRLRQVQGTLQIVELHGAALLAEEMVLLTRSVREGGVTSRDDAFEVLMRAILQLPDYLEHIQTGHRDIPIVLLPLLNDLRTARNASLLSESVLFFPDMEGITGLEDGTEGGEEPREDIRALAKRSRHTYQLGLLGLFRHKDVKPSLNRIQEAISGLRRAARDDSVRRLFWIGGAVAEALANGALDASVTVKQLLGRIDRMIRVLIQEGEAALAEKMPPDLIKNLIYYVGRSRPGGEQVQAVKRAFRLNELLPEGVDLEQALENIRGPNQQLLETVSRAIREDLAEVKDGLDVFMHSDHQQVAELGPLVEKLHRMADTMAMLGMAEPREMALREAEIVEQMVDGQADHDDSVLMDVASRLLKLETSINGLVTSHGRMPIRDRLLPSALGDLPSGESRTVITTILHEALADIARAKGGILDFVASPVKRDALRDVPDTLSRVAGALNMLALDEVAAVLGDVRAYIEQLLCGAGHAPGASEQEALAESVTAIELYLETLDNGSGDPRPMLDTARSCLSRLGAPVPSGDEDTIPAVEAAAAGVGPAEDADATWILSPGDTGGQQAVQPDVPPAPAEAAPVEPERYPVMSGEMDEEIMEIFLEETQEEIDRIRTFLAQWQNNPADQEALTTMRRSFHTLKGSGRLVGAQLLGEFAWSVENLLNRVIEQTVPVTAQLHNVLDEALRTLPTLRGQLTGGEGDDDRAYGLMARAHALARGESAPSPAPDVAAVESPGTEAHAADDLEPAMPALETQEERDGDDTRELPILGDQWQNEVPTQLLEPAEPALGWPGEAATPETGFPQGGIDEALPQVPEAEALEPWQDGADEFDTVLLSEPAPVPEHAWPDGDRDNPVAELPGEADDDATRFIPRADLPQAPGLSQTGADPQGSASPGRDTDAPASHAALAPAAEGPLGAVADEPPAQMDPTLLEIFRNETGQHLNTLRDLLAGAAQSGDGAMPVTDALLRAIHTLNGAARTAEVPEISAVCGPCERYVKARADSELPVPAETLPSFRALIDHVSEVLRALESRDGELPSGGHLAADMQRLLDEELARSEAARQESASRALLTRAAAPATWVAEAPHGFEMPAPDVPGEQDLELVDIFLEEGVDILDAADNLLEDWRRSPQNQEVITEFQRQLHTLKGGARMAGFRNIGDLSHALESLVIEISEGRRTPEPAMLEAVGAALDRLSTQLGQARRREPVEAAPELIRRISDFGQIPAAEEPGSPAIAPHETAGAASDTAQTDLPAGLDLAAESLDGEADTVLMEVDQLEADEDLEGIREYIAEAAAPEPERPAMPADGDREARVPEQSAAGAAQELVRVRSEVLDNLVNFAGEVNIYHARLGQQITGFGFNLAELSQTVSRLREQLRKLELETEAQILFRYEKEKQEQGIEADFDPLELDRYSNIQQLSRALAESINDLVSIQEILSDQVRDSETLLLQQSRVSTDLQEGLMRTRMVQFASMAPRLRRVVRQTAAELGKRVELELHGEGSELDRSVLERMVAPLEHMLRNAVYHGIEPLEARRTAGKPETGHIRLDVTREGSEVVIRVNDDGGGINLQAVREKARRQGLTTGEEVLLTDEDVMQFILEPGFSTASEISQISGRGVGMDVVNSEIKQLGGTLIIESVQGQGTHFTVRLPFTLAINQALLVQVGEDIYAVPLSSIEGIVRMRAQDLTGYYELEHPVYDYAGNTYEVKHLGALLDVSQPNLRDADMMFPVLLVRSGEHRVALHVDGLLGSREVVVKSVGPQVAKVRGISGATILGDGRVVLILDVPALVRIGAGVQLVYRASEAEPAEPAMPTVMVVDDSITIRKVTARMLERNHYRVITAKDGLDAVAQLQDHVPDIMLLDIEMPRMDGYELATHMRNDSRLRDVPIIMITSRTGEKHRQRALDIGVDRYLGKPYQEADLLANIKDILPA
jgi:chemosensory pili system protein ChpA (sensor histidine kinase/response regulator)